MNSTSFKIDNLQYCNWSKEIFQINNEAKLDAIHVTIAYHEDFNEVEKNVDTWNKYFKNFKLPPNNRACIKDRHIHCEQ